MGRLHRLILVAAAVGLAGGVAAAPAPAAPVYTLFGVGDRELRPGIVAAEVGLTASLGAVAIRHDGVFAFTSGGAVYLLEGTRIRRAPVPGTGPLSLAFAPDGGLLVGVCGESRTDPSVVFRAAPERPATVVAGRLGARGSAGDGGSATAASLDCPLSIAVDDAGGILIADAGARRIRRVRPDGVIETVAGTGARGARGDGGPATRASFENPTAVTALPGRSLAVLDQLPDFSSDSRLRVVDSAGTISTRLTGDLTGVSGEPGGSLLLSSGSLRDGSVRRLAPNGATTTVTRPDRDNPGIPYSPPVADDPFELQDGDVQAALPTPDGGVLVVSSFALRYVPPATPRLLAVAIQPPTRRLAARLSVAVRTTRPARLYVGVWRGRHRVASLTAITEGGDAVVPVRRGLREGVFRVRVRAEGDGQAVGAQAEVIVGGLPASYARQYLQDRLDLLSTVQDSQPTLGRCARVSRRRVDCAFWIRRRCAGMATMRLRADGTLAVSQYRSRSCRSRP